MRTKNGRDDEGYWYMAVAQGKSLKSTGLARLLTKKEIHEFLTVAPSNGTVNGNLWWTRAHTFGGKKYADMIVDSKLARNEFGRCARFDFWVDVMRFFANNPPRDLDDLNDYLDFLDQNEQIASMRGRRIRTLALLRDEWHMRLYRSRGSNAVWRGVDIPNTRLSFKSRVPGKQADKYTTYEFWQIENGKDLAREGRLMRNCVFSYLKDCIDGRCSIWSVIEKASPTGTGKHVATLEMSSEKQLVQARGVCNSTPAGSVKSAIEIWARRGGIVSSPHLF